MHTVAFLPPSVFSHMQERVCSKDGPVLHMYMAHQIHRLIGIQFSIATHRDHPGGITRLLASCWGKVLLFSEEVVFREAYQLKLPTESLTPELCISSGNLLVFSSSPSY
mmetsp:Transcript_4649/g.9287  ORF Transcript_4649/g.9287 Transcript_4649/m.9287 type:complete len:109 (-) Transcript_4649:1818-2144(-)